MYPQLWKIPILGLPIYSYGFMIMLGFLAGIWVASARAKREGLNPEIIFDFGIIAMIAGIIGARIAYIIIFSSEFTHQGSWNILNIFDGDLSLIGVITGWFIPFAIMIWKKKKITFNRFAWLLPLSIVSAIILGRIIQVIFNHTDYDFSLFAIWKGGLVFYGGLILATPASLYYIWKKKISILKIADIVSPSVALGLAFGRIGCLLNGCCFGKLAEGSRLGICFPNLNATADSLPVNNPVFAHQLNERLISSDALCSLPVYPTQVFEAIFCVVLFAFLAIVFNKKPRQGLVLGLLMLLYSTGRFTIEFWRGDKDGVLLGLTDSQLISLGVIIVATAFLIYLFRKPAKEVPAT
ncbi:MAG: prolipoprotein diacylglyceryl transferase [Planctomycetes bacterium]|nr:prolipoprotein diacylglyceryl transferase [Planctomycetota bacterium]